MAATFGTPIAATLLAVELLLFEWKPRSFIPVALAAAAAMATRHFLFGAGAAVPGRRARAAIRRRRRSLGCVVVRPRRGHARRR